MTFTDIQIITILTKSTAKETMVLEYLYQNLDKPIRKFILSNGGESADADDVIQDAIIVFYENVKAEKFQLKSSVQGYIYTVGKYIWYNRQRKSKKYSAPLLDDELKSSKIEPDDFDLFDLDKTTFVESLLEQVGKACKAILVQSIYEKKSMQEIAKLNNLKNEQVARNKKHKCLKKLRKIIEESSYFKFVTRNINL